MTSTPALHSDLSNEDSAIPALVSQCTSVTRTHWQSHSSGLPETMSNGTNQAEGISFSLLSLHVSSFKRILPLCLSTTKEKPSYSIAWWYPGKTPHHNVWSVMCLPTCSRHLVLCLHKTYPSSGVQDKSAHRHPTSLTHQQPQQASLKPQKEENTQGFNASANTVDKMQVRGLHVHNFWHLS